MSVLLIFLFVGKAVFIKLKCYTKTRHKGVEKQRGKVYNKEAVK